MFDLIRIVRPHLASNSVTVHIHERSLDSLSSFPANLVLYCHHFKLSKVDISSYCCENDSHSCEKDSPGDQVRIVGFLECYPAHRFRVLWLHLCFNGWLAIGRLSTGIWLCFLADEGWRERLIL